MCLQVLRSTPAYVKKVVKPFVAPEEAACNLILWWKDCTLLAFSQSASWGSHLKWFSSSLEGVLCSAEHLVAALPSLCVPTHPKPSQLGLGWVILEASPSDTALHHSPSWSDSHYKAWRCVLVLCPVGRTNDGPTKCKTDGMECRCRMLCVT